MRTQKIVSQRYDGLKNSSRKLLFNSEFFVIESFFLFFFFGSLNRKTTNRQVPGMDIG